MKWFNDLKITFKVTAGFIVMLIFMCYIGINAYIGLGHMNKYLDDLYSNRLLGIDYLVEADRDLQQLLVAERTLMLSKNNPELFKTMMAFYEENMGQSADRFAKYKALAKTKEENAVITRYENKRIDWEKATREVVGNISSSNQNDFSALLALSLKETKIKFEDMRDEIDKLEEITLGIAKNKIAEGEAIYKKNSIILIAVISIAVLFAMIMGIIIIRSIKYRINSINNIVKDLSEGEGDLTVRISDIGYDEFKSLGNYFNTFMNTLEKLVVSTKKSSLQVESISNEVSSGNLQLSSSTQEIVSNIEEINANIKEIASSVNDTASSTATMAKKVMSIAEKAETSSKMLANVTEAMNKLKDSGEKITAIVDVVNEIAFQTNLLALNAAVEAAHAGEDGKGFAVVAVEVRNLAARSTGAVKNIKDMVAHNNTNISNIDKISRESAEILTAVLSDIYDTRKGVKEIEDMSFRQASGIEQINIAISQIDKGIQENAAYVEELATTSESMNNVAHELTNHVHRFKVSEN